MNDKLPFDSLSCGSRMWCETFFGNCICSLLVHWLIRIWVKLLFFSWSVPKYFLRWVLQWMLWTRTRTLRCITPLAMVWRGAWIFCWRTEPLCKLNLLALLAAITSFFFLHYIVWLSRIASQHPRKHGWQDAHWRCEAQQPGWGSQVAGKGCLPVDRLCYSHGRMNSLAPGSSFFNLRRLVPPFIFLCYPVAVHKIRWRGCHTTAVVHDDLCTPALFLLFSLVQSRLCIHIFFFFSVLLIYVFSFSVKSLVVYVYVISQRDGTAKPASIFGRMFRLSNIGWILIVSLNRKIGITIPSTIKTVQNDSID